MNVYGSLIFARIMMVTRGYMLRVAPLLTVILMVTSKTVSRIRIIKTTAKYLMMSKFILAGEW